MRCTIGISIPVITICSATPPRPPSLPGGYFGLKLFIDAQTWIKVPWTEKCSLVTAASPALRQRYGQDLGSNRAFQRFDRQPLCDADCRLARECGLSLSSLHQSLLDLRSRAACIGGCRAHTAQFDQPDLIGLSRSPRSTPGPDPDTWGKSALILKPSL